MAAYAALALYIRMVSLILNNWDVVLHPLALEAYKFELKELKSFRDFVERLDSRSRKRMNASLQQIAEAVRKHTYESDYANLMRANHSLVEQFQKVKEEYYALLPEAEQGIASSSSSRVVSKSKMVGLRDKWRLLKDNLITPYTDCTIYLLYGMAGIGKTALAREIFEDLDIMEWFDCHAWVTVGIEWKSEEITKAILAQVAPDAHKMIMGGSKEEIGEGLIERLKAKITGGPKKMGEELKKRLKGKRYLIVLDDVWNEDVHEYLESSLPMNKNGSCVLLTSRMKYVGLYGTNDIHHIYMRLLNEEESWDLLREKVFAGERCPPHLVDVGKKIAEKCDGLPLTILIIAGFLSKADESIWMDVAVKKKHQFFINAYDQISEVLYPSYNMLLDQFKMSFLYMGAFLLKYEIPKSRLINLWVAEDLVETNVLGTLETTASFFLWHFESNSLVLVCQRDITSSFRHVFSGHVKSCRLHSSWWYFC